MRNADESRKSKHDSACAMTVATNVSSAGRASDAHRDRQVVHQKVVHNPRHPPVFRLELLGQGAICSHDCSRLPSSAIPSESSVILWNLGTQT